MKISKARLKQVIKEELQKEYKLNEGIMDSIRGMFGGKKVDTMEVHPRVKDWEAENFEDALNAKDMKTVVAARGNLQRICQRVAGGQNEINYPDTALKCKVMQGELRNRLEDLQYDQNAIDRASEKAQAQADYEYEQSQRDDTSDFLKIPDRCQHLYNKNRERELEKCIRQERERQRKNRSKQYPKDDKYPLTHNTDSGYSAPWAE